ncbi:DUF6993 domain-containing protein [Microbacterium aurantiacum]|uniref:DUF6993 domain-containing protein n=1 Tax=Microbacterium aurantiacum TaxID=162393 RepID=A0A0N0RRC1_9MICO|nr:hypothetical protein [Microbacterium chocolatum]ANG85866.1 hypothetical protein A8L33_11150 [Microbacterium chocolatum]KOS10295.1 hypothetical protein XI38_10605 [Microbacterium chocolatum]
MSRSRREPSRPPARRRGIGLGLVLSVAVLSGCVPEPTPVPTAEPEPSPTVTASETSAPPVDALIPDGSAEDNLPFFSSIVGQVWASDARESGRAYVDALVAAGFDKAAMQVTEDLSTVGNRAESLQFSVRWGQQCLVGQVGPATGEPFATVTDVVGDGACLLGQTRPIDW